MLLSCLLRPLLPPHILKKGKKMKIKTMYKFFSLSSILIFKLKKIQTKYYEINLIITKTFNNNNV